MSAGAYIVIILLLALVGVLVTGVVLMGIGGNANAKYGNKLMAARVWIQGAIVVLMLLLFFTAKS